MKRTLRLRRETLTELSASDLTSVVGGDASGVTCPAADCLSRLFQTCRCATGMC